MNSRLAITHKFEINKVKKFSFILETYLIKTRGSASQKSQSWQNPFGQGIWSWVYRKQVFEQAKPIRRITIK